MHVIYTYSILSNNTETWKQRDFEPNMMLGDKGGLGCVGWKLMEML